MTKKGKLPRWEAEASAPITHQALLVALPVAVLHRLALVVQLLALGERELDLGAAPVVEIKPEQRERRGACR